MRRPVSRFLGASGLLAGVMVIVACTAGSGSSTGPTPSASTPPAPSSSPSVSSELILRVANEGGFIAPGVLRAGLPTVSVYADGRIVSQGAVPAIYPGPLVPPLVYRSVGPDGARAILKAAEAAGLTGADALYPGGPVADAPQTVFTVVHDGGRTVSRFNALGIGASPDPSSSRPIGPGPGGRDGPPRPIDAGPTPSVARPRMAGSSSRTATASSSRPVRRRRATRA